MTTISSIVVDNLLVANTTTNTLHPYTTPKSREVSYYQVVVLSVLSIFILCGNVSVLLSLRHIKTFRFPTKILIASLCTADILVALVVIPIRVNELFYASWTRYVTWCKAGISINIWNLLASLFNLLAISTDRLIFIVRPLHYHQILTKRCAVVVVITIWLLINAISFIPIFTGLALQENAQRTKSDYLCKYATTLRKEYLATIAAIFITPLLIFATIYFVILWTATKALEQIRKTSNSGRNEDNTTRSESKDTLMILLLVVIFYACYIPHIVGLILSICRADLITPNFIFVMAMCLYLNSFFNSIVYYCFSADFRRAFKKVFCGVGGTSQPSNTYSAHPSISTTLSSSRT